MQARLRIWLTSVLAALLLFTVPASSYRITDGPTEIEAAVLALRQIVTEIGDPSVELGRGVKVCAHFHTKFGLRDFPPWLLGDTAKTSWLRTTCLQHQAATWLFPTISCGLEPARALTFSGTLPVECWILPPNPNGLEGRAFGFEVGRSPTLEFRVVRTYEAIA